MMNAASPSPAAIAVRDIVKTYAADKTGAPKHALRGVSLEVPTGSIFGLLGPNGAGKSTLINILAGLVNKTSGQAQIWGFDIDADPRNAKLSIGVVPQELVFDAYFTPFEVLELQAGLYGVPKAQRRTRELLNILRLEDKAHAYARTLSGGMKRRLLIAKALVHQPPILVLDEPTAGVDIELRQQLWAYVRDLNAAGTTIVLTTHYLEEAEDLCDRIAIIHHGQVVANADKATLLKQAHEKVMVVTLDTDIETIPTALLHFKTALRGARRLAISYDPQSTKAGQVLAHIAAAGLEVVELVTEEADLEDIFLNLTRLEAPLGAPST
jgi:ABC-2 type transport system ATP-binding protein